MVMTPRTTGGADECGDFPCSPPTARRPPRCICRPGAPSPTELAAFSGDEARPDRQPDAHDRIGGDRCRSRRQREDVSGGEPGPVWVVGRSAGARGLRGQPFIGTTSGKRYRALVGLAGGRTRAERPQAGPRARQHGRVGDDIGDGNRARLRDTARGRTTWWWSAAAMPGAKRRLRPPAWGAGPRWSRSTSTTSR